MVAVSQLIRGWFGVYGARIIVSSIGVVSRIIVSSNFGITIGGISEVFNGGFGVEGG